MISKDIIDEFSDLAKDRGIERTNLGTIIEDLFYNLIQKKYGEERDNFSVIVNMEKGEIEIYQEKEVVDEVIDEVSEINIKEAKKHIQTGGSILQTVLKTVLPILSELLL